MLIVEGNSIPNPYESPTQPAIPLVAKRLLPVQRHASFAAAALCGLRMSLKWSSIIFAPVALLLFLLMAGAVVYRGLFLNDWSDVSDPVKLPKAFMALGGILGVYVIYCCTACVFGAAIYMLHHALTPPVRPKSSATTEDS